MHNPQGKKSLNKKEAPNERSASDSSVIIILLFVLVGIGNLYIRMILIAFN
jgi:hypothetical protein